MDRREWVADGGNILLLGWRGDATHDALYALLLTTRGLHASNEGAAIRVFSADQKRLGDLLTEIATGPGPTAKDLQIKPGGRYSARNGIGYCQQELRVRSYISAQLDTAGAQTLARTLIQASDHSE